MQVRKTNLHQRKEIVCKNKRKSFIAAHTAVQREQQLEIVDKKQTNNPRENFQAT